LNHKAYEVDRFLDPEPPYRKRQFRTLETLELVLDKRMRFLEEGFEQHLAHHRAKEMETDNEKVKAT